MINGAKVVLLKAGAETIPNQVSRAPNHTANLLGLVLRCIETALQLNTSIEIHFAAFFQNLQNHLQTFALAPLQTQHSQIFAQC